MVAADEIGDPSGLRVWLEVDGKRMQDGTTANMIFKVDAIVASMSRYITLHPGDIIATGTPAGVGNRRQPKPVFLKAGQRVRAGVEGLGVQDQLVV